MAKGLFIGFSEQELLSIRDAAKAAVLAGSQIVNYSDSGTSVGKQITLPADVVLLEVRYALRQLDPETYGLRRRHLSSDLSGYDFKA